MNNNKQSSKMKLFAIAAALVMFAVILPFARVYPAPKAPAPIPAGWTEVKTADELKEALNNAQTTQIMFGADIRLPESGIMINSNKPSLTIDGNGYKLSEPKINGEQSSLRLEGLNKLTTITIQNVTILGHYANYSPMYVKNTKDVTIIFKDVEYTGPFLVLNALGTVRIIDCDISLITNNPSSLGWVAYAKDVYLEGNTTIVRDQPTVTESLFFSAENHSSITITEDANINISNNQNNNSTVQSSGFVEFDSYYCSLAFEKNSKFSYVGNNLFTKGRPLSKVLIDENANVEITTYGNLSTNLGIMAVSDTMNVNKNSFLDIRAFDNNTVPALLQPRGSGVINFNEPKEVFIYNISTAKDNTGLAIGPRESTDDVFFNNIHSLEYWKLNTAAPDALPTATREFVNTDGTPFSGMLITDFNDVISASAKGYNGVLPFTAANTAFKDINVIRIIGEPTDPIKDEAYIEVIYRDADTGAELDKGTFTIASGNYGPYNPKQEITSNNIKYIFQEWSNTSDPQSGTINIGETKTIIFTYRKTDSDFKIEGVVLWDDFDNRDNTRPNFATVILSRNGLPIQVSAVFSNTDGKFIFDGLEEYDSLGNAYVYSVDQFPIADYITEVDKYTITNILMR